MGRVRRPRGGLRPAAGLWGPPVGTGRARRSGAGPRPPAPRRPTRGPRRAQKGRGYQASPRCWFPSTALQPTPNPCLVPEVFLAELGRQITLLAINDCPPEDDDYDWQQNQRPQCVSQECQTGVLLHLHAATFSADSEPSASIWTGMPISTSTRWGWSTTAA